MILDQLAHTARRFCECRPKDFIPREDRYHIALAYDVNDRFDAREFDERAQPLPQAVKDWLEDCQAIAYALVSLRSRSHQSEFPPPIGRELRPLLGIAAATDEDQIHLAYRLHPTQSGEAYRLTPLEGPCEVSPYARQNFFRLDVAEPAAPETRPAAPLFERADAVFA